MNTATQPETVYVMEEAATSPQPTEILLLTGGIDRPYVFGLAMSLLSRDVRLEIIGGDEVDSPEMHTNPHITFINLHGKPRQQLSWARKLLKVSKFYVRLLCYTATARPKIIHILWNNKFQLFDRSALMVYYRLIGKRVVLTVHNVNAGRRDRNDSVLNRLSLKVQYRLAHHIFVHTHKMKRELLEQFRVCSNAVTVIPFGINNSVPKTQLTSEEARQRLGIERDEKAILFFGAIRPYKGIEYLIAAFQALAQRDTGYRLIIVGEPKKGCTRYLRDLQDTIARDASRSRVIQKIEFVPDKEIELYFKAADIAVLPYTLVFQSGVLFLSYSFGLPVIATDVGSFCEDIIPGKTGYLCLPCDTADLARTIETYFKSNLYKHLDESRQEICDYAGKHNSWDVVGKMTQDIYAHLLGEN